MGIGNTMKHMFENASQQGDESDTANRSSRNLDKTTSHGDSASNDLSKSKRASNRLPSGTGPGTSGKSGSETVMEHDLSASRSQGAQGYGTDAAAAYGGSLSSTHQASFDPKRASNLRGSTGIAASRPEAPVSNTETTSSTTRIPASGVSESRSHGHLGILDPHHATRHKKEDLVPTGDTTEDTNQLNPVTHEHVHHYETEEVERVKQLERHIHHVQHHTQPIIAREDLAEKQREFVHPVTRVEEQHVNKAEDNALFEGQVHQHRDSLQHSAKERTIVDKGYTVNEHVHHHIHHIIQPVIEKDTFDRERIHTIIPIHEVTHEAPVVHQSQTHAPIPLEHFIERGGALHGGISQDEIGRKVLRTGKCTRDVDGAAEELEEKLHLGKEATVKSQDPSSGSDLIKTTVTQKTTTVINPEISKAEVPPGRN